jgi:phosphoribosylformylglycinamidine (FGAM) synthase-like enzyme
LSYCHDENIFFLFIQEGIAMAIGEQPIKGLVDAPAGARMAVAESITNLVFARISDIQVINFYLFMVFLTLLLLAQVK